MIATDVLMFAHRIVLPATPPDRILVVPAGNVESTAGDFVMDPLGAQEIIANFAALKRDLVVDLEHQTLGGEYAAPNGQAPAQAWIKALEWADGQGLWADVEWTEAGAAMVASKAYRYLSPVVLVRKADRRAMALHSVGMTNDPAIVGMKPIVNSSRRIANTDPKFEAARWFLNLETTASEETIVGELEKLIAQLRELAGVAANADQAVTVAALKAKLDAGAGFRTAVCKAVELDPAKVAKDDDVVAAINARKAAAPAGDVVPRSEFDVVANSLKTARDELASVNSRLNEREAAERIADAQRAGKLTDAMLQIDPSGKNYFRELAKDGASWKACMDRMPAVAPADGRVTSPTVASTAPATDRVAVINRAKVEYTGSGSVQRVCGAAAFINDALRQAKLTLLTPEERKQYAA